MFMQETNAELKAAMYASLGQKRIAEMFDTEKIDESHENGETLTLWRTKEVEEEIGDKLAWIECKCPSTNTEYWLGVDPSNTDAREAMAGLWGVETGDYFIDQHT